MEIKAVGMALQPKREDTLLGNLLGATQKQRTDSQQRPQSANSGITAASRRLKQIAAKSRMSRDALRQSQAFPRTQTDLNCVKGKGIELRPNSGTGFYKTPTPDLNTSGHIKTATTMNSTQKVMTRPESASPISFSTPNNKRNAERASCLSGQSGNIVSVRELLDNQGQAISRASRADLFGTDGHPQRSFSSRMKILDKDLSECYQTPQYSWKKPNSFIPIDKKLDYICLIAEESKPGLNLTKIFMKKKHLIPGPTAYNTTRDWSKKVDKKGRFLKAERITPSAAIFTEGKKTKTPGPCTYKVVRKDKVKGAFNLKTEQMELYNNQKWYSTQTPGCHYKLNWDSTEPKSPAKLIYPRDRANFKSPGLTGGIKKTKLVGPGQYELQHQSVERRCINHGFTKGPNKNFVDRYVSQHKATPPPGRYPGYEKAFTKLSRPLSCLSRKRV